MSKILQNKENKTIYKKISKSFLIKIWEGIRWLGIAFILYFFIPYFISPEVILEVNNTSFDLQNSSTIDIQLTNKSSQDIYDMNFGIRFGDKHPIKKYSVEDINAKSDIILRSYEDISITDVTNGQKFDSSLFLMGGLRGYSNTFPSGATTVIHVLFDMIYDGSRGDLLPQGFEPMLRNNSYSLTYNFIPLGLFSNYKASKNNLKYFNGNKSALDNCRKYKQFLPSDTVSIAMEYNCNN